jgi:acyl-CoA synthetase (AMP-forming)/AMP-acid ligase II
MDEREVVDEVRLSRDRSGWLIRRNPAQEAAWRAEGAWTGCTLADHARAAAREAPDHVLLIEGDAQVTAAELLAQATRAAGALIGSGLKPGDVVSFQLPNWREACVLTLAATLSGLIINPIIPIYRGAELVHILTDSRSRMIFIPAVFRGFDYREMARGLRAQIARPPEVVVLRGDPQELTGFEAWLARDGGAPLPSTASSDLAMALYTSGTTGPAKGVLHTHDTVDVMVRDYERCWGPWKGEALIVSSPLTHITGAIQALHIPIQVRATAVLMDVWDPDVGLELVKRHRASYFGGATPFLRDMLAKAQAADEHLPSLRIVACGGAAVPPGLMRGCHAQFPNARVFRAYGCTEVPAVTEGVARRGDIDYGAETDGWIGATRVRLVRPGADDPVADGEEGEILACGAQMFVGYSRPEDNDAVLTADGFFRTGDLGRVRDGYLTVTGRLKDLIIRNGENLSAKEIEDALDDMPQVAEVAIVGAPSERTGEAVCAFVVPKGPSPPDVAALAAHLSARGLARQKFPERVVIVGELPRNAQGKIRKDLLRAEVVRLLAAESRAPAEPPSASSRRKEYSRG